MTRDCVVQHFMVRPRFFGTCLGRVLPALQACLGRILEIALHRNAQAYYVLRGPG